MKNTILAISLLVPLICSAFNKPGEPLVAPQDSSFLGIATLPPGDSALANLQATNLVVSPVRKWFKVGHANQLVYFVQYSKGDCKGGFGDQISYVYQVDEKNIIQRAFPWDITGGVNPLILDSKYESVLMLGFVFSGPCKNVNEQWHLGVE